MTLGFALSDGLTIGRPVTSRRLSAAVISSGSVEYLIAIAETA